MLYFLRSLYSRDKHVKEDEDTKSNSKWTAFTIKQMNTGSVFASEQLRFVRKMSLHADMHSKNTAVRR